MELLPLRGKFGKKIVVLCIILVVLFTPLFIYAFIRVGSEPVILIGAFFSFITIELWNLKDIKNKKTKVKEEDLSGE